MKNVRILYDVEQNEITEKVVGDFMFATYDECVAWCNMHNK